jgi:hypothetical protein
MADIEQTSIDIEVITKAIEQKMGTNIAMTGINPELAGNPFGPHYGTDDGITRYKEIDTPANDEADDGGLFTLTTKQPGILEWIMMDLGASVAYTVAIVTSAGDWQVAAGTAQFVILTPRAPIMPGENVKITAAAPGAGKKSWARVYVRSDQARH